MTLPPPPYTVVDVGDPRPDQYGNTSSFIRIAEFDDRVKLGMKQGFPRAGDVIADRVIQELPTRDGTSTYFKLVKPQSQNGSQGGSRPVQGDAPTEAYWAGQNAAKGRSAAQDRALQYAALKGLTLNECAELEPIISWFEKDVHAARDRAVAQHAEQGSARAVAEASPPPGGSSSHDSNGIASAPAAASPQPSGAVTSSDRSPTEKQTETLLKMARERGLDGAGMKRYLKAYCRVEQFSQLPKNGCIDQWAEALKKPDPGMTDIPVDDPWPPEDVPAAQSSDDSDIPF